MRYIIILTKNYEFLDCKMIYSIPTFVLNMTVLGSMEFSLTICPRKFGCCLSWLFLSEEEEEGLFIKCCILPLVDAPPVIRFSSDADVADMILFEKIEAEWWPRVSLPPRVIEPVPDMVSVIPISFPPIPLRCVLQEILSSSGIVGGGRCSSSPVI